ncbi:MAG: hypothetical protein ACTHMF_01770 [Leifsonia sp.]|uniref:hypothetical protein n=1 Tax=Leifsonia sp. TaxID=1870902 RepID=UPI003F7FC2AF
MSSCDADGDSIPDEVERIVAGTATGATGREDTDGDGVPGGWAAPDALRGLLAQPKSLARYPYVYDNPAMYVDPDGHVCARRNSTDALPLGCGPTQTPQAARPVPANPPPPVPIFDREGEPIVYADGPE